jgi:hypothetical protein
MRLLNRFFKAISLRKLLGIALVGMLLLTNVACSNTKSATPGNNSTTPGQAMYPHKDTERDTSAADAKADRLVRQAEQRQQKVQSPKDWANEVTPDKSLNQQAKDAGRSAKQAAENIGKSTQRAAQNAAENTQAGLSNLKENAQSAADKAGDAVNNATTPNYPNS